MTDEMKLLRAFIEAQGYEIEEIKNCSEVKMSRDEVEHYHNPNCHLVLDSEGLAIVDKDGMYTQIFTSPDIDYKVTKKESARKDDVFSLGYQVAREEIRKAVGKNIGVNQMNDLMDTIIFHVNRR